MVKLLQAFVICAWVSGTAPALVGCQELFFEGIPLKTGALGQETWALQRLRLDASTDPRAGMILSSRRTASGLEISQFARSLSWHALPTASRAKEHWRDLAATTLHPSFRAYGERRSDFDPQFNRLLEQVAPSFTEDGIHAVITLKDGTVVGSLRLLHAPFGFSDAECVADSETVSRFGYHTDQGFRDLVVTHESGFPRFVLDSPPRAFFTHRPPRLLQGEQILGIEADRSFAKDSPDGGIAWELTNFFIDPSLPRELHNEIWLELWSILTNHLFSGPVATSFHFQKVFTYGSLKSLHLYSELGARKLNRYFHRGKLFDLTTGIAPPISLGKSEFWPMELDTAGLQAFHLALTAGRITRFSDPASLKLIDGILMRNPPSLLVDPLLGNRGFQNLDQVEARLISVAMTMNQHWNEMQKADPEPRSRSTRLWEIACRYFRSTHDYLRGHASAQPFLKGLPLIVDTSHCLSP